MKSTCLKFTTCRQVIHHFNPPCVYLIVTPTWFKVGSSHRPASRIDEQVLRDVRFKIFINPTRQYRMLESRIHSCLRPIQGRLNFQRGRSPARDSYPNTPQTRRVLKFVIKMFEGGLASGDIKSLRSLTKLAHGNDERPHWKNRTIIV